MAVPKRKQSKQRTNTRYSQWKLNTPNLVECPNCKSLIKSHEVCPNCGQYNGKQVLDVEDKKA